MLNDAKIYPTSSEYYATDDAADKEREDELDNADTNSVAIREFFDRLNESIKFYASVDSITKDVKGDEKAFMHYVRANQIVVEKLRTEMAVFELLLDKLEKR